MLFGCHKRYMVIVLYIFGINCSFNFRLSSRIACSRLQRVVCCSRWYLLLWFQDICRIWYGNHWQHNVVFGIGTPLSILGDLRTKCPKRNIGCSAHHWCQRIDNRWERKLGCLVTNWKSMKKVPYRGKYVVLWVSFRRVFLSSSLFPDINFKSTRLNCPNELVSYTNSKKDIVIQRLKD